jgi:hypothetical protein
MSTIKVDNIRIASESVSRPVTGVAAAWVNFDAGGTGESDPDSVTTIRDGLNVDSVTDRGIGYYTVNYSNDMNSTGYSASSWANALGYSNASSTGDGIPAVSSIAARVMNSAFRATDSDVVCLTIHGDLA